MKIIEAINQLDSLVHNTYEQSDKVKWLSRLDGMVKRQVIDAHEGEPFEFKGYDDNTDTGTEMLIPAPYDAVYLLWMEAQIHYYNGEYEKYNNAIDTFDKDFTEYKNYYTRTHMPKGSKFKFF